MSMKNFLTLVYSKESKLTVGKTKYETCDVSIKRFEVLIKIKNV